MMRLIANENGNGPLGRSILPNGWNITEYVAETVSAEERTAIQELSMLIRQYLPGTVTSLHHFIDALLSEYNIVVHESYIEVDEQATVHITILVTEADFHSPELVAARLHIPEFIPLIQGDISTHVKFSVAEEYHKSHYLQPLYKLRYVYKSSYAA